MAQGDSERVREAQKVASSDPKKAEQIYKDIVSKPPSLTDAAVREYETALISLGELYRDQKSAITVHPLAMTAWIADVVNRNTQELVELVTKSRTVLSSFAKAKTAKLGMYLSAITQLGRIE